MSKRKNGEGSWGKKKVGKYVYVYYRDPQGNDTYGKTEKEVKEKLKEKEKKAALVLDKQTTFGEYIKNWHSTRKTAIEESTYDCYEDMMQSMILDFKGYDLANKQLPNLSMEVFQCYLDALAEKYSRSSIKKMWTIIKSCVEYGEIRGEIPLHTTKKVSIPKESVVAVKKKEIPFLSEEDAEKFYQVSGLIYGNGVPVYGSNAKLAVFIMYSGCRISEALALKWKDVDFNNREIHIKQAFGEKKNRNAKEGENKHIRYEKEAKTEKSSRVVPVPDRAIEMLRWFEEQNPNHTTHDYIFKNKNGELIQRRRVNTTIRRMTKKGNLSVDDLTAHPLRHTYGYLLYKNGVNMKMISELLGHSSITVTMNIYVGLLNDDKHEAIQMVWGKKKEDSD